MFNSVITKTFDKARPCVFYKARPSNPYTPQSPPALGRGQQGLSNKHAYPSESKNPTGLYHTAARKMIQLKCKPHSLPSNQSPGLNLLFDRNIAYRSAEQEKSLIAPTTNNPTGLHQLNLLFLLTPL